MTDSSYTLADFLTDQIASQICLLTSPLKFSTIEILSVSVQEPPVENFIQPHELVLSTAVNCLYQEDAFLKFIQEVKNSGAAALLLAFQDPSYVVPDKILDFAAEVDLPIFSIAWDQRFSEIQEKTTRRISEKKLATYKSLQTELFNAFFNSILLVDAIHLIDSAFQTPVVIEDATGHVLANSRKSLSELEIEKLTTLPIHLNDLLVGYLRLKLPEQNIPSSLGQTAENLMDQFLCFPLSLWFNRQNIEDLVTTRLKNDFVWALATKNYDSFSEIVQQGRRLHFDLTKPYSCAVLRAIPSGEQKNEGKYATSSAVTASNIESLLIHLTQKQNLTAMISSHGLDFILFLENYSLNPEENIDHFITTAQNQLEISFPQYTFRWGISEISSVEPVDFNTLYCNAHAALQYCLASSKQKYRFTYQDSRTAQVISALSKDQKVCKMAEEVLAPLKSNNIASGVDFIGTLLVYVKCKYNITQTAQALHIHRQSLLYRLEKIESLTKMSLNNEQDRFLLEIAVRLLFLY